MAMDIPEATPSNRDKAIQAFLELLSERRFEDVGLAEVAGRAGLKLSQLRAEFGSTLASSASRSAICAQREASGVFMRRIRIERNWPLAPPQASSPIPARSGVMTPTVHGSRRAHPGYSTGGAGG